MKLNGKTILLCDCEGTMALDGDGLLKALGGQDGGGQGDAPVHNHLCRAQIDRFKDALLTGEPLIVACTQEAPLFSEVAADVKADAVLGFTNIRERAAWSDDAARDTARVTPKIAALLAEAAMDIAPTPTVSLESAGRCLVVGGDDSALALAEQLADRLDVTLLVSGHDDITPPAATRIPLFSGAVTAASGHLGAFTLTVADFRAASVSSRAGLRFDGGGVEKATTITTDLILDLTGGAALFPGPDKRDGYERPDPGNPAAVQKALYDLSGLVGSFEKPRYIAYDADICAHSRSAIAGCSRCIDACPTAAITPAGDNVAFDPFVCAGCGQCAAVCPTGAAVYAMPEAEATLQRLRTLLAAYFKAGGEKPTLLLHDARHGDGMIAMMARHGRGLPASVLPFALNEVTQTGLDFMTAALAYGVARMVILVPPGSAAAVAGLETQIAVADALMDGLGHGAGRITLFDGRDPEQIEARLHEVAPLEGAGRANFLPLGGKRTVMSLALGALHKAAPAPVDVVALPADAPFGRIMVDTDRCTLCLACVGACPAGAIRDNPDSPELSLTERLCVQCGLCAKTCPESAITLEARYNFTSQARDAVVLHSEEPFECVRCGTPFGVKSAIEHIVAKLAGKHSMFAGEDAADRIRMCDTCRVAVEFEDPAFNAGTQRPRTRTTDDDLREREEARARTTPTDDDNT